MPYTQYTRDSFTAELAQTLSDPNHVYWAQNELERALYEAIYLWGAITSYWTTRATFSTSAGVPFYDLSVTNPTLRARTYTFDDLTREIQYHLLEPANGINGTGMTDQFTISQIINSLTRHRNEFVMDARLPLSFTTISNVAASTTQVTLSQNMALITRAAWIDTPTGIVTPLRRTDSFAAQSLSPVWNSTFTKPYAFSQAEAMPMALVLVPANAAAGAIHVTYVSTEAFTVSLGTLVDVPNEFALAVKYSALHDLVSTNSQGYDPIRSKYCEERYRAAMELAALHRSVIQVRSGSTLLPLSTVASLDSFKPYWQTGTGVPQIAATAYDLLGFYHVPDAAYTISVDLVQSAPLPASGGAFIQVGAEEIPYLFDYCRHILQIKVGGVEFVQSMPLYDNFLKGAMQRSKFIGYKARYLTPLFGVPSREETEEHAA